MWAGAHAAQERVSNFAVSSTTQHLRLRNHGATGHSRGVFFREPSRHVSWHPLDSARPEVGNRPAPGARKKDYISRFCLRLWRSGSFPRSRADARRSRAKSAPDPGRQPRNKRRVRVGKLAALTCGAAVAYRCFIDLFVFLSLARAKQVPRMKTLSSASTTLQSGNARGPTHNATHSLVRPRLTEIALPSQKRENGPDPTPGRPSSGGRGDRATPAPIFWASRGPSWSTENLRTRHPNIAHPPISRARSVLSCPRWPEIRHVSAGNATTLRRGGGRPGD